MNSDAESVNAQILALIEEARQQAYTQGYRDAVQNIMAAAGAVDSAPASAAGPERLTWKSPRWTAEMTADARVGSGRAPWGLVPKAINRALDEATNRGISVPMVIDASVALGYRIAESSVRSMINQMTKTGEIERRDDGRWHRVTENGGVPEQERPAASDPIDQEGGLHETTALAPLATGRYG